MSYVNVPSTKGAAIGLQVFCAALVTSLMVRTESGTTQHFVTEIPVSGSLGEHAAASTFASPNGFVPASPNSAALRSRLLRSRSTAELDDDGFASSLCAIEEALAVMGHSAAWSPRYAYVTDDGIAVLQWQGPDAGVMLMFAGDGFYSLATNGEGKPYSLAPAEHLLTEVSYLHDNLANLVG